jgi:hypothetical protein
VFAALPYETETLPLYSLKSRKQLFCGSFHTRSAINKYFFDSNDVLFALRHWLRFAFVAASCKYQQ